MARTYGIEFPLLSDSDHALAKQYAGLSTDGYPIPAVYVLKPDGTVYSRKIGDAKDDRIYAAELLQILDSLGGRSADGLPGLSGYGTPYRVALGLGLGGHRREEQTSFAGDVSILGLRELGSYLGIGMETGSLALPVREVRGALVLQGQLPLWSEVGELYVQLPLGMGWRFSDEDRDESGVFLGLRLGLGFEISPKLAAQLESAFETLVLGADDDYQSSRRLLLRLGVRWNL